MPGFSTNAPGLPRRSVVRPPSIAQPPSLPRGPKWEQQLRKEGKVASGPGTPPKGFVTGTTSGLEWGFYWGCFKVLAPTRDPRNPPYYGIDGVFRYQKAFEGGRDVGGSVVDFVFYYGPLIRQQTAVRIQTVQFHDKIGIEQQVNDRLRKVRIASRMPIVDVYDYQLLNADGTFGNGSQIVIAVKQALGLLQAPARLALGTTREVRYDITTGR